MITVDMTHKKEEIAQHLAENAISVVGKTTLAKCVNPRIKDLKNLSQSMTQESRGRLLVDVPINA